MESWSLRRFVDSYGQDAAAKVMNMSRQALYKVLNSKRTVRIVLTEDGYLEAHESKILGKVKSNIESIK